MLSIVAVPKYSRQNLLPQWLNRIIIIKSIYIIYIHIWLNRNVFILCGNRSQQPPGSSTLKSIAESGCYQIRLFFMVCRPKCRHATTLKTSGRIISVCFAWSYLGWFWWPWCAYLTLTEADGIIRKPNTHPLYLPVSLVNMWVFCVFF